MKFRANLMFIGSEAHANKEGEAYWKLLFVDGVDPLNVITKDENIAGCQPYVPYDCEFNYNTKYERLQLLSMKPLK